MKLWLKIFLAVIAALLFIKLLPLVAATVGVASLVAAAGLVLVTAAALLIAGAGVGFAALLLAVALVVALGLSPIWLPILLVVGIVKLVRGRREPPTPTINPTPVS